MKLQVTLFILCLLGMSMAQTSDPVCNACMAACFPNQPVTTGGGAIQQSTTSKTPPSTSASTPSPVITTVPPTTATASHTTVTQGTFTGHMGSGGTCECGEEQIDAAMAKYKGILDILQTSVDARVAICSLGVKVGGLLSDDMITASTKPDTTGRGDPRHARLNTMFVYGRSYGGWRPHNREVLKESSWVKADLGGNRTVAGVVTQGQNGYPRWVKTYRLSYSLNNADWTFIKDGGDEKVFPGNEDNNNYKMNEIDPPVLARYVRIHPLSFEEFPYVRFDVLSC